MLIGIFSCFVVQLYLFYINTSQFFSFCLKEADNKYFRFCRLHSLCYKYLRFATGAQNSQRQNVKE